MRLGPDEALTWEQKSPEARAERPLQSSCGEDLQPRRGSRTSARSDPTRYKTAHPVLGCAQPRSRLFPHPSGARLLSANLQTRLDQIPNRSQVPLKHVPRSQIIPKLWFVQGSLRQTACTVPRLRKSQTEQHGVSQRRRGPHGGPPCGPQVSVDCSESHDPTCRFHACRLG